MANINSHQGIENQNWNKIPSQTTRENGYEQNINAKKDKEKKELLYTVGGSVN